MVPVAAAIILHDSKILIARRAQHKFLGGLWEFPGGKIEAGESSECCLRRELDEELQIKVEISSFLIEQYFDYGDFSVSLKVYVCQFLSGLLSLVDHDEVKWVDPEDVLSYQLAPADVPIIKYYLLVCKQ
jgi:8-oxo-dGTP diphosphatase